MKLKTVIFTDRDGRMIQAVTYDEDRPPLPIWLPHGAEAFVVTAGPSQAPALKRGDKLPRELWRER
jgi:hypothetical protein